MKNPDVRDAVPHAGEDIMKADVSRITPANKLGSISCSNIW
jgi:hypothetical protein